jgi:hypothetical protein
VPEQTLEDLILGKDFSGVVEQMPPSPNVAKQIFELVSMTFSKILHSWPLSNTSDRSVVVTVNPVLGYPQKW